MLDNQLISKKLPRTQRIDGIVEKCKISINRGINKICNIRNAYYK